MCTALAGEKCSLIITNKKHEARLSSMQLLVIDMPFVGEESLLLLHVQRQASRLTRQPPCIAATTPNSQGAGRPAGLELLLRRQPESDAPA